MPGTKRSRRPNTDSTPSNSVPRYLTLGQVARRLGVQPAKVGVWVRTFGLEARRNSAGRRIFTEEEVRVLERIKYLRETQGLSVAITRFALANLTCRAGGTNEGTSSGLDPTLLWIRQELSAIRDLLKG